MSSSPTLLRPTPLPPKAFKAELKRKRWLIADAAVRWNIRPDTLSKIIADTGRETSWDDMLRALPHLTAKESRALRQERIHLLQQKPARKRLPRQEKVPVVSQPMGSRFDEDPEPDVIRGTAPPGLRYQTDLDLGDEFVAIADCDQFLAEGQLAVLINRRLGADARGSIEEAYCLENANQEHRWFTPDDLDCYVVMTGRCTG